MCFEWVFFSTDIFTSGKAHQQRFAGISDLENGDICSSRISSREDGDVNKKVSPKSDPQKWGIHFEVTHSKGFPKLKKILSGFPLLRKKDTCPLSLSKSVKINFELAFVSNH